MTERTRLSGPYRIVDHDHLRRKLAETADPRQPFYLALESHSTYEAYLAAVGGKFVPRPGLARGANNRAIPC